MRYVLIVFQLSTPDFIFDLLGGQLIYVIGFLLCLVQASAHFVLSQPLSDLLNNSCARLHCLL